MSPGNSNVIFSTEKALEDVLYQLIDVGLGFGWYWFSGVEVAAFHE